MRTSDHSRGRSLRGSATVTTGRGHDAETRLPKGRMVIRPYGPWASTMPQDSHQPAEEACLLQGISLSP
jgi:hypothetical protein